MSFFKAQQPAQIIEKHSDEFHSCKTYSAQHPMLAARAVKSIRKRDHLDNYQEVNSFARAEAGRRRRGRRDINRNGLGYKIDKNFGWVYKIMRRNIKADANGDPDEREVFRLNKRDGINQNKTRLKANTPNSTKYYVEDGMTQLIDSSKEEYIRLYYGGKGRQIRVGDYIKFHHESIDTDVEGKVVGTIQFVFRLKDHRFGYYYRDCTNIKVKENGFFVDGFFKSVESRLQ